MNSVLPASSNRAVRFQRRGALGGQQIPLSYFKQRVEIERLLPIDYCRQLAETTSDAGLLFTAFAVPNRPVLVDRIPQAKNVR